MHIVDKSNQTLDRASNLPIAHHIIINFLLDLNLDIKILYDFYNSIGNTQDLIVHSNLFDVDKLGVDLVIVSVADHPREHYYDVSWYDSFKQIKTPIVVLNAYSTGNDMEIYCPIYALYYLFTNDETQITTEKQLINSDRNYIFSCLNNKPKTERLLNLLEIYQRYKDKSLVSLKHSLGNHVDQYDFSKKQLQEVLSKENYQFLCENIIDKTPIEIPDDSLIDLYCSAHPAYFDAYLNIVTEYGFCTKTPFISEKTIKPVLSGQFFVILSTTGSVTLLESLGFDTFRDIIDHSVYENQDHYADYGLGAIKKLHDYLETTLQYDWKDVYDRTLQRRLSNRNLILGGQLKLNFIQQLKSKIERALI
jgi:hypothetical protein